MTTHDIFRAKDLADKLGIMVSGELAVVRTRDDLVHEDLEKLYLEHVEVSVGGKTADTDPAQLRHTTAEA